MEHTEDKQHGCYPPSSTEVPVKEEPADNVADQAN